MYYYVKPETEISNPISASRRYGWYLIPTSIVNTRVLENTIIYIYMCVYIMYVYASGTSFCVAEGDTHSIYVCVYVIVLRRRNY